MHGIAVVGAHRSSKFLAPYADPGWQIWSLSPRNQGVLPRHDAWFELHAPGLVEESGDTYRQWLQTLPLVYMHTVCAEYPGSVAYPKDTMVERFGGHFFTSSIAWMLALAITQRPDRIGLWGVECATPGEYGPQRWGVLHFLAMARASGIEVILPKGCGLARPSALYGYETASDPIRIPQGNERPAPCA